MKTKLRRIISIMLFILLLITGNIYAAGSFSVSANKTSLNPGGTATITISTNNCAGKFSISSSNSSVVAVSTSSSFVDGTSSITATAKGNGTATITITAVDVSDTDLNDVTGSKSVTIKVTTPATSNNTATAKPSTNTTTTKPSTNTTTTTKPSTNNKNTTTTLSNNAYLKEFRINQPGITPTFSKTIYNYAVTVGEDINRINVTAVPEHSNATAVVTGNTDLKEGENTITVRVTAQDKKTIKTYKIIVTKTDDPVKSNAYLQNLIITNATLNPGFSSEVFEYDLGSIDAGIDSLDISAFPVNEKAKVDIVGNDNLITGENTIKIIVTSENSKMQKTYTLKVNKEEANSLLDVDNDEENSKVEKGSDFSSTLSIMGMALKENATTLLLYAFVWIEFLQVVYLYEKVKKLESKEEVKEYNKVKNVNNSDEKNKK